MDNNFTMPSRTRALLYGDEYDNVVRAIADSFKIMCDLEVDYIILVCGTAHAFLPDVYKIVPEAQKKVLNIIDILGEYLKMESANRVLIIAAEGALKQKLYPEKLKEYGIQCINPEPIYYDEIRYFIECVKRNTIDIHTARSFITFLKNFKTEHIILGCTEFPILVKFVSSLKTKECDEIKNFKFYDPLEITISELKTKLS